MSKLLGSLQISVISLLIIIAMSVKAETKPLVYEDFESYTGGALEGWSDIYNPKSQYTAVDFGDVHGNCFAMKAESAAKKPALKYIFENALGSENVYRISFYIRRNQEDTFLIRLRNNDGGVYKSFTTGTGLLFYTADQGNHTRTLCEDFNSDSWYKVEMWLDFGIGRIWYTVTGKYNKIYTDTDFCELENLKSIELLQFNVDATVYIDEFAVEIADRDNIENWIREGEVVPDEIAHPFVMTLSSDNMGNIFFDEEIAQIYLDIKNRDSKIQKKSLHISLKNVYDKEIWSRNEEIELEALSETRITVLPPLKKYGTYILEVTDGELLLCSADLSRSVENDKLNFKTGVYLPLRSGSDPEVLNLAKKAGFGYGQVELPWSEDEDGNIIDHRENAITGMFISKVLEVGMKVTSNGPTGNRSIYDNPDGGFSTTPEALAGLEKYYEQTARMLKGEVENFSAGFEIVYKLNDDGTRPHGSEYAEVLRAAYTGMKAGNPDAKLSAFNDTIVLPESRQLYREALDTMRDWGVYYFDAIGTHPFPSYPPEAEWFIIDSYLDELVEEYGLHDKIRWANSLGFFPYNRSEEEIAKYFTRLLALNEALDSYDVQIYMQFQSLSADESNYGMLRSWKRVRSPHSAKPQYVAFSWWNKLMNGAEFESMENTDDKYICYFTNGDKKITLLWDVSNSGDKITLDLSGKPAKVYDKYGNLIDSANLSDVIELKYSDDPLYVVEEEVKEIEMKPLIDMIKVEDLWNYPLVYTAE